MIPNHRLALDVSNNNPIHDSSLKIAKPAILICKATEGTSFKDATLHSHRELANRNGITFGSYLFLHPGSKGNEAEFFLEYSRPRRGEIVAVDVEVADGFGMATIASRAKSCLRTLTHNNVHDPLLYCSASWWKTLVDYEPALRSYRVWEAQYPGHFTRWTPEILKMRQKLLHGASVVLWQWTDHYEVGDRFYDASRLMIPAPQL